MRAAQILQREIIHIFRFAPDFTGIFQYMYTGYFVWTSTTICATLLMFQIEIVEYISPDVIITRTDYKWLFLVNQPQAHGVPNSWALVRLSCLTFWSFASAFIFCDTGDRLVTRYNDIDIYYNCDWYLFPDNIKRVLPMVIVNMQQVSWFSLLCSVSVSICNHMKMIQNRSHRIESIKFHFQPVTFAGFGNIKCNRETLKRVIILEFPKLECKCSLMSNLDCF